MLHHLVNPRILLVVSILAPMGTGCSVSRSVETTINSPPNQNRWLQLEPTTSHHITLSTSPNTTQNKLSIFTNDIIVWNFTPSEVLKWRVVEVWRIGTQLVPIQGGTNILLDELHNDVETVFHFPLKLTFAVIEDGLEFNENIQISYLIRVTVVSRHPIRCGMSDTGFEFPYLITHIGLTVVFTWKGLSFPVTIARGEVDSELQLFRVFNQHDTERGRSGQVTFTPLKPGVVIFAVLRGMDEILDICSVRSYTQSLSHLVEISAQAVSPIVSEISTGTPVLFHLSDTEITFTDAPEFEPNPLRKRPYFYRTFPKQGIFNFATVGQTRISGFLIVQQAPKRHKVQYTPEGFDSLFLKCKVGDFICLTSQTRPNPPLFSVTTARPNQSNGRDLLLIPGRLINKFYSGGYVEYRILNLGVHVFRTELSLVVIASAVSQTHNIIVNQNIFNPFTLDISQGDCVLWYWGRDGCSHNIVQVSFEGERIPELMKPVNSGAPSFDSGFHHQFDHLGSYYFISQGHTEQVRGEIIVWPSTKVHTIVCPPTILLKPGLAQVCVNDWVVWVSPPHIQIQVQFDDVEISEYSTQMTANCCVLNVPEYGLISLVLSLKFIEMDDQPLVSVPFYILCDQLLVGNLIHLPLLQSRYERCLHPGDFVVLSSNDDKQIEVVMNSTLVDRELISIPLSPLEMVLISFWIEGVYHLKFLNQLIVVKISHNTSLCTTPCIPKIEWNEVLVGESITFEDGQNIFYTLDGSYPTVNSPETKIICKNTLTFQSEGFVVMRAVAFQTGYVTSKVQTSPPIRVSNYPENRVYKPNITFQTLSLSSARINWFHTREAMNHIFKHVITNNDVMVPLETHNSCLLGKIEPGTEVNICLQILDIESDNLLESVDFKFDFPFNAVTTCPEVTVDKHPQANIVRVRWERQAHSIPVVKEYSVYVDHQLYCCVSAELEDNEVDRGDKLECVVLLEHLEEGELYIIQVSAVAIDEEDNEILFESQEIQFNYLQSKSVSTESPKISTTDFDARSSSVESDELSNVQKFDEPLFEEQNLSLLSYKDVGDVIGLVSASKSTSTMTPIIESEFESESPEMEVLEVADRCESGLSRSRTEGKLELGFSLKDVSIDSIVVYWKASQGEIENIVLQLDGDRIHTGREIEGKYEIDNFTDDLVHCVSLLGFVDDRNCVTENMYFVKQGQMQPVSLKTEIHNNSVEIIPETELTKTFQSDFTNETQFLRNEISQTTFRIQPNSIQYSIKCESPHYQSYTYSAINTDDIKTGFAYLSFIPIENKLTLFDTKPGDTYTVTITVVYPEYDINTSQGVVHILPAKSPVSEVVFTTPAPPRVEKLVLVSTTSSAIQIQWDEATVVTAPILRYVVFINGCPCDQIFPVTQTNFSFNDPIPGTKYTFTVLSLTNHACGNSNGISYTETQNLENYDLCHFSSGLEVQISKILTVPIVRKVVPCFGTSVKVFWHVELQNEDVIVPDCFALLWKPVEAPLECDTKRILSKSHSQYSYKLLGLLPWKLYTLQITSYTKNGKHSFTEAQSAPYSFLSPGPPLPPLNLLTDLLWFDRIRLKWDNQLAELKNHVSYHIWVFVYYENKVFVRFERVDFDCCHFEMMTLKSNTNYLVELYSVRDDLSLVWENNSDPIEAYEMKSRILPSLHSCVKYEVRTLTLDLKMKLEVTANDKNEIEVFWGEITFPESVELFSYSLQCFVRDDTSDIHCEESSNRPQMFDLPPTTLGHIIHNISTGLLYQIQLHCNLLHPEEPGEQYKVILKETPFRLPAPPEKPTIFLSEINESTLVVFWNKSLTHQSDDRNIKCIFLGYNIFLNGTFQRMLTRESTKYTICVNREENSISEVKLVALGKTTCLANSRKMLVFEETNESKILSLDLGSFGDYFISCSMQFIDLKELINQLGLVTSCVSVAWDLKESTVSSLSTIKLVWWYTDQDNRHQIIFTPSHTEFLIENPIPKLVCASQIILNFSEFTIPSPILHCQVPSPPKVPIIYLSNSTPSDRGVRIKWHEPRQYSDNLISGYQLYNDDMVIGPVLQPISFEAFLPIRSTQSYKFKLQALTVKSVSKRVFSNTIEIAEEVNGGVKNGIKQKTIVGFLKEVKNQSIEVGWHYSTPDDKVPNHFRVEWSCVAKPIPKVSTFRHTISSCILRECIPGVIYFIHIKAMAKSDKIIAVSSQIKVQTPTAPGAPQIALKNVSSSSIELQWKKPTQFGDATISEYVLFVDQSESVKIGSAVNSYCYNALPCREYTFRLQALTNHIVGNSKLSNILILETPGLKVPVPRQISAGRVNSIAVAMETIVAVGNVKIDKIDVFCAPKNELLEEIENYLHHPNCVSHVDLDPATPTDTFHSLTSQSDFVVFIRAADNLGAKYFSEPVGMSKAQTPITPLVTFTNISLNKRNKCIEEVLTQISDRTSLLLKFCWQQAKVADTRTPKGQKINQEIGELSAELLELEKSILVKLKYLQSHSSLVSVLLSWEIVSDTAEVFISGYQVFVNGSKHLTLSNKQTNCTVEVNKSNYPNKVSISLRAITEHSIGIGHESEILNFDWQKDFATFSYFCLNSHHPSDCSYLQTFQMDCSNTELKLKQLTTRGYFDPQDFPHFAKVWNVCKRAVEELSLSSQSLTLVVFFTIWCKPSRTFLELFSGYSDTHFNELRFICVCVNSGESHMSNSHTSALASFIQTNRYDTTCLEFMCACGHNLIPDPTDLYSITGVPTLAIFHPNGSLAWLGHTTTNSFLQFESFLLHTIQTISDNGCVEKECKPKKRSLSSAFSIGDRNKTVTKCPGVVSRSNSVTAANKAKQGGSHPFAAYSIQTKTKKYTSSKK